MMKPRTGNLQSRPEKLGEILGRLFTTRGWGRRQGRLQLENAWADAAGPEIQPHTRVVNLRHGVLEVEVDNGILHQELANFHKKKLLAKMQKNLPSTPVTDIRFRAGHWK